MPRSRSREHFLHAAAPLSSRERGGEMSAFEVVSTRRGSAAALNPAWRRLRAASFDENVDFESGSNTVSAIVYEFLQIAKTRISGSRNMSNGHYTPGQTAVSLAHSLEFCPVESPRPGAQDAVCSPACHHVAAAATRGLPAACCSKTRPRGRAPRGCPETSPKSTARGSVRSPHRGIRARRACDFRARTVAFWCARGGWAWDARGFALRSRRADRIAGVPTPRMGMPATPPRIALLARGSRPRTWTSSLDRSSRRSIAECGLWR